MYQILLWLLDWSQKSKEFAIQLGKNVQKYIEAYPLKENVTVEYLYE